MKQVLAIRVGAGCGVSRRSGDLSRLARTWKCTFDEDLPVMWVPSIWGPVQFLDCRTRPVLFFFWAGNSPGNGFLSKSADASLSEFFWGVHGKYIRSSFSPPLIGLGGVGFASNEDLAFRAGVCHLMNLFLRTISS